MQPLKGIRVLDVTKVLAGPTCTQYLGDLGADVIKVEPCVVGDDTRRWPPFRDETGAVFLSANRNKRSLALNLKAPAARAVIHRLAERADVALESFGTGVAERLGIDAATLRGINPRLIHCTISGFGRSGPLANALGYDVILQAFSGMMSITGHDGGEAVRSPISPIDQTTGLHALTGILAALIERGRTGVGTQLEVSLFETALAFMAYNYQSFWERGTEPARYGSSHEALCPYQAFAASDEDVLIGIANDNLWGRFCRAVDRPEWIDDPRFRTGPDRAGNRAETVAMVAALVRTRTCADWIELLTGIGVPCAPVNSLRRVLEHPHTAARGIILDYQHPALGPLKGVAHPVVFDGAARQVGRPPPMLGADSRAVLRELDYAEGEIDAMVADGTVLDGAAA